MKTIVSFYFIIIFYCINLKLNSQIVIPSCVASPYPVEIIQPDGSKIIIIGKGNSKFHFTTTIDGYTIVRNSNGVYEYAVKDAKNEIVTSGIKASNPEERKKDETEFLNIIPKGIRYGSFQDRELKQSGKPYASHTDTFYKKAFPHNGTRKVLLLLIEYPDMNNSYTTTAFDNLMNQMNYNGTGSFKDYYNQASQGQLILNTDVFGWYVAAKSYLYYSEDNGENGDNELVAEAIDAAEDAGVNFSQYDNDLDGYVDGIIVVHSGPGAEEGSQTQYIWSHIESLGSTYNREYDGVIINN